MTTSLTELGVLATTLARESGELLRSAYAKGFTVTRKSAVDLVTDADRLSEEHIISGIRKRYADHAILAEESGGTTTEGEYRWVIDPLDGTVNFAHRIPHFSVLIAVQKRMAKGFVTELGVVYDPVRDELFVAERGQGATLNGQAIRVSTTDKLIDALGVTGFSSDRLLSGNDNHREFCLLNLATQGVRRFGSAGLDLAYVACGRFDFYWETGLKAWDLCAGALLVAEAHGRVSDLAGEPIDASLGGPILASNALTHDATLAVLAGAPRFPINAREALLDHLPADLANELRRTLGKNR